MTKTKEKPQALAWVDIETTGLDEQNDAILELAIVLTPMPDFDDEDNIFGWSKGVPDLGTLATFSMAFRPTRDVPITSIDPYVWNMHNDNGLWAECMNTRVTLAEVVGEARAFMRQHCAVGSPMCGSSVHFDRRFLQAQAPYLMDCFHYRNLDVSSIRNMLQFHLAGRFEPFQAPKKNNHRAFDDIHQTLEEYRYYLSLFTGAKSA